MKNIIKLLVLLLISTSAFAQQQKTKAKFYLHSMNDKKVSLARPELVFYETDGYKYMAFVNNNSQVYGSITGFVKEVISGEEGVTTIWVFDWVNVQKDNTNSKLKDSKVAVLIVEKVDKNYVSVIMTDAKGNISSTFDGFEFKN